MEHETIQERVGHAEARLRSSRSFLIETVRDIDAFISRGEDVPDELSALSRCAASNATASAVEVVDAMYTSAGSSSVYSTSRLDRCFRDVHMITQHAVGGLAGFTIAGRYFMGLGLPRT